MKPAGAEVHQINPVNIGSPKGGAEVQRDFIRETEATLFQIKASHPFGVTPSLDTMQTDGKNVLGLQGKWHWFQREAGAHIMISFSRSPH